MNRIGEILLQAFRGAAQRFPRVPVFGFTTPPSELNRTLHPFVLYASKEALLLIPARLPQAELFCNQEESAKLLTPFVARTRHEKLPIFSDFTLDKYSEEATENGKIVEGGGSSRVQALIHALWETQGVFKPEHYCYGVRGQGFCWDSPFEIWQTSGEEIERAVKKAEKSEEPWILLSPWHKVKIQWGIDPLLSHFSAPNSLSAPEHIINYFQWARENLQREVALRRQEQQIVARSN